MKMNSREKLVGKKLEEGERHGYFAPSRSHSPAPSYVLSPSTTVVNWGNSKNSIHSASSSVVDLPRSRNGSIASLPAVPQPARIKPSPLRLNPAGVPFNGRVSPTNSVGGSYRPPLPSPRSVRSFANPQAQSNWVSPLDVHFSRPTTPQAPSSRPQSYLPRLQFPEEIGKNAMVVSTPPGSVAAVNSEAASPVSSNVALVPEPPQDKSSTFNFNFFGPEPPKIPSRGARHSTRSIFPATSDDERPVSRRSAKSFHEDPVPIPTVPQNFFGHRSPGLDPNQYGGNAIIRESIVSKRSVSIYQPQPQSTEPTKSHLRTHSRVASSVYSTTEPSSTRTRSLSPKSQQKSRSRSRSTSSKRAPSSQALSRTQDSVRRHSRKMSLNEKRRSRERDQIHYDPTSHHRNRSGSVQGRSVDFDRPRESPFSNAHSIEKNNRSASSSVSMTSTAGIPLQKTTKPPVLELGLGLSVQEPDRLSVMTGGSRRGRSASEASQSSMGFGDFYDSYYRQSVLAQRASVASQVLAINNGSVRGSGQDLLGVGVGVAVTSNGYGGTRGRPPPLKLGGSGLAEVVEVASPAPSPMVGERFPSRI
jgi:hypothetical protein